MNKAAFTAGLIALAVGLNSCTKKSGVDNEDDCPLTVAALAGKYKLVAAKFIEAGGERDVLHEIYEDCELDDTNELKADKTFVYTDAGVSCSPNTSESGTWDVVGQTLILNSGMSNIESFNCTELVVTYRDDTNQLVKETYRKL